MRSQKATRLEVVAALALMSWAAPAAAVNKCKAPDGKVHYQDAPCPAAEGEKVNLSGAGEAQAKSQGAQYWRREADRQARLTKVQSAIANGQVAVGMTANEVIQSWGNPTKVNATVGKYGRHEQWVYSRSGHRAQYVYVENGEVTSIQTSQ